MTEPTYKELQKRLKKLEKVEAKYNELKITSRLENKESYKIFNENPCGMSITRMKDSKIIDMNKSLLKLSGYKKREIIGRTALDRMFWVDAKDRDKFIRSLKKKGKVEKQESLFCNKDGIVYHCQVSAIQINYEGEECFVSIVSDITSQKKAELSSRINLEKYERLVENSPDILHIYSNKRGGIFWSSRISELLGFTLEDIETNPRLWHDSIHPGDIKKIEESYADLDKLRKSELTYRIKDIWGHWHWFRDKFINIYESEDEIVIEAIASDITREKTAEEALQKLNLELESTVRERTEELFRANRKLRVQVSQHIEAERELSEANKFTNTLIESANVMVIGLDKTGNISIYNKAAKKITGYTKKELEGINWFEKIVPKDKYAFVWKKFEKYTKGGALPKVFENPILTKSGKERFISWRNVEVHSPDKNLSLFSFGVDITDRKAAEEALHQSEERFRLAVSKIPALIWMVDSDLRFTFTHGKLLENLGLKPDQTNGMTMYEYFGTDDEKSVPLAQHKEALGGKEISYIDTYGRMKIDVHLQPIFDSNRNATHIFGVAFDVTEKTAAENALKKSEVKYRSLIKNMLNGYALHKVVLDKKKKPVDYIYLEVNDAFEQITGLKGKKIIGKKVTEVLPGIENSEFDWIGILGEVALTKLEAKFEQYSEELKKWFSVTVQSPKKYYFVTIIEDITERREAEEALIKSEEHFRTMADFTYDWEFWRSIDNKMVYISPSCKRISGYSQNDFIKNPRLVENILHPDNNSLIIEHFMTKNEQPESIDFRIITKNGKVKWINHVCQPVYNTAGDFIGHRASNRDITDRKEAEDKLMIQEERLELALEATSDGMWDWNINTGTTYFSPRYYTMLGYEPNEMPPRYETWEKLLHPDDVERTIGFIKEHLEARKESYEVEFRMKAKTGEWRWILARGKLVERDKNNEAVRMVGTHVDITERKISEESLINSRKELLKLSDHLQTVRENERTHIAREIHDELGQSLTALKIDLSMLKASNSAETVDKSIVGKLESMISLVNDTISSVQRISAELRPRMLDVLGLSAAIQHELDQFSKRTGVKYSFRSEIDDLSYDLTYSTTLFRILQESITNVARHAKADHVDIIMKEAAEKVFLEIHDNGKGINNDQSISLNSLGLIGMRERANAIGGALMIKGEKGKGTSVTFFGPLKRSKE
ncbi:MAG: PAS domain S-box protein [bacterium]|nr:PAS domain S-box protein [bacterium]